MATLTTAEKAPIVDADGVQLGAQGQTLYDIATSDAGVVVVSWEDWRPVAVAQAVGEATLTATRLADGAVATLDVEVVAATLPPFTIDLGAPVPK